MECYSTELVGAWKKYTKIQGYEFLKVRHGVQAIGNLKESVQDIYAPKIKKTLVWT